MRCQRLQEELIYLIRQNILGRGKGGEEKRGGEKGIELSSFCSGTQ
jgi:hypothetical protein